MAGMISDSENKTRSGFIYRYVCSDQERALCNMEIGQLLGQSPTWHASSAVVESSLEVSVQRSPYMKYRLHIWLQANSFSELLLQAAQLRLEDTYKIIAIESIVNGEPSKLAHSERRAIERDIGVAIGGMVDLQTPNVQLGVVQWNGIWLLGEYERHRAQWQQHDRKPRHYSTALSTRVARAIVNIAVPQLERELILLDPCCGIGTVLLEAASQGITVKGYDMNPLAVVGARENMQAFNYTCDIAIADMRSLQGSYDVAIIDLPYNHCSVLPAAERQQMLRALKNLSPKAVIVSVEPIEEELRQLGATIVDKAIVTKTHFKRDVWLVSFN
jgi:tRNA G10  N-methylase Trm11